MRTVLPLLAALLLQACGRLGFDEHTAQDAARAHDAAEPAADGGETRSDAGHDAQNVAADSGSPDAGAAAASGCGDEGEPLDYCRELPPLAAEPVIDGVRDCGPALRELSTRTWQVDVGQPADAQPDVSARYAIAWRPNGIYFYVEVDDPVVIAAPSGSDSWCGDGPEVYLDADGKYPDAPDYEASGVIQLLSRAPAGLAPTRGGDRYRFGTDLSRIGPWTGTYHIARRRPGGYALEALVDAKDLDVPSVTFGAGGQVGVNVAVNVSVPTVPSMPLPMDCPLRLGQFFLRTLDMDCQGKGCLPYQNVGAFCTARLRP